MRGATFINLDELAARIMGHVDHAVDRATALGGLKEGRVRIGVRLLQSKKAGDAALPFNGSADCIHELADLYVRTGRYVRHFVKRLVAAGDFASADLLADILRTVDTDLWLLEAHIGQQQTKPGANPCFTRSLSS